MHRTFLTVPMEYSFSESHRGRAIFAFMFLSRVFTFSGDAADAFGALPAGHNAWAQGEFCSTFYGCPLQATPKRRQVELLEDLETYTPGPLAIKVSLGLHKTIYQVNGVLGVSASPEKERADLGAGAMWGAVGCPVAPGEEEGEGMYL
ncbi:hypothetical protein B0H14DRAFT_3154138 [Mycena olivaceomarginata]|nr:hypothetical protein B0H14DRAFT_3154138 [Mycena olivaceomarginata]